MRNISPWLVRRDPKTRRKFQVISFNERSGKAVIAKEFNNVADAQEFADEANRMLGCATRDFSRF